MNSKQIERCIDHVTGETFGLWNTTAVFIRYSKCNRDGSGISIEHSCLRNIMSHCYFCCVNSDFRINDDFKKSLLDHCIITGSLPPFYSDRTFCHLLDCLVWLYRQHSRWHCSPSTRRISSEPVARQLYLPAVFKTTGEHANFWPSIACVGVDMYSTASLIHRPAPFSVAQECGGPGTSAHMRDIKGRRW